MASPWKGLTDSQGAARPGEDRPPKKDDSVRRRYEFVVMMLWREPQLSEPTAAAPTKP